MKVSEVITVLDAKFQLAYPDLETIRNETMIPIRASQLHDVIALLQQKLRIAHLTTITAQITAEAPAQIQVYYHFWRREGFTLALTVPCEDAQLPSIIDLLPGADFYEREVAEMFGITFTGRAQTPRLLLPDDWDDAPPMRMKEKKTDE